MIPLLTSYCLANVSRATWADDWFQTLKSIVLPVIDGDRKDGHKRVRIAILDTGVDAEHREIQTAISGKRIKEYQGFPESLDPLRDENGHGTHGTSVLLRTAPNAVIYICRVADNDGNLSNENGYFHVAKV